LKEESILRNTLSNINQTLWELKKKIKQSPDSLKLRKEFLKLFYESAFYIERKTGVPDNERSFLLLQERESLCCMLIHGGGGSPHEMRLLGNHLYKHGYTVYGIRLPLGNIHNGTPDFTSVRSAFQWKKRVNDSLARSWSSCLSMSEIALETLLDYTANTYVIGFSFGGTIALNVLKRYPVRGAVLIAPALVPLATTRSLVFKALRRVLPLVAQRVAPREDTILDLAERTRASLGSIQQPILVIQAVDDPILSMKGFEQLRGHASNPRSSFVRLERGGHVLVGSDVAPDVYRMCSDFIKEV
jgi:carboxylesterase